MTLDLLALFMSPLTSFNRLGVNLSNSTWSVDEKGLFHEKNNSSLEAHWLIKNIISQQNEKGSQTCELPVNNRPSHRRTV